MRHAAHLVQQYPLAVIICLGAFVAFAVVGIVPVVLAMSDAAMNPAQAVEALADGVMWGRLLATLGLCGVVLAVIVPLGLAAAWVIARTDVPLRRVLMMALPFPLFLPPLVHVLSWFSMTGLSGPPAIVTVYVISFWPFVALMAMRSFEQVGREHHETMRIIGGRRLVFVDEMRQGLPGAMIGGVLALVFMLSDFAVADFLTSVGPSVTVWADSLYAHHLGLRSAAAAGASLPGLVLTLLLLMWALRRRRTLGAAVGSQFTAAPAMRLGAMRLPCALLVMLVVAMGSALPLGALLYQAGSFAVIWEQLQVAMPRIRFTITAGAVAATLMAVIALPLGMFAARLRRAWWLDVMVFLPLAVPPLVYGIGLVRMLNRPGLDAIYLGLGAVIVAMVGRYLAFAYLPIGGAIERLEGSMHEAARLAGGGAWSRFRHVVLPLLVSPIVAAWCVSFCFTLRELDTLIMLRSGQQSLTFHLYANVVFARQDEIAAIALILATLTYLPLLLYLGFTRRALRFL